MDMHCYLAELLCILISPYICIGMYLLYWLRYIELYTTILFAEKPKPKPSSTMLNVLPAWRIDTLYSRSAEEEECPR